MSSDLYEYLCEVVGSEEIVQMRRRFFNVMNSAMTNKETTVIYSGSKAEGLDMAGSDIDIMIVKNAFSVLYVTDINDSLRLRNNMIYLLADTENANPGFAVLKPLFTTFRPNSSYFNMFLQIIDDTDRGHIVSNRKFKELHFQANNTSSFKVHGPSLSPINSLFDLVFCLGGSWPHNIKEWMSRPRYSGWPTEDLIFDIVQQGVCFVPIGSKFGSTEDNPHEWRISFSIAEKMLINSFNHVQLLCYAMFKIILKDILQTRDDSCQLLCSYYLKTVMFWVIEENVSSLWIPQNFVSCFRTCFNRLVYYVTYGYCPNYFIPTNNMFEGKVTGNAQNRLLKCLTDLHISDTCTFLQSEILMGFFFKNQRRMMNAKRKSKDEIIDCAIYPLLYGINNYLNADVTIIADYIATCLRRIRQTRCHLDKQLFLFLFCRLCRHLFLFTIYDFEDINRKLYRQFKQLRSYVLLGTYNEVSGWIWVALLFYKHGQFANTRDVIDHVLSECTPEKMLITQYTRLKPFQRPCSYRYISFIRRHKLSCVHQMTLELNENTCLFPLDLGEMYCSFCIRRCLLSENVCTTEHRIFHVAEIQRIINIHGNNDKILAPPLILAQFIKFMSYHHQGDTQQKLDVLRDMKITVESNHFIEGEELEALSGTYFNHALLLSNYRPIDVISVNGQNVILFIPDASFRYT